MKTLPGSTIGMLGGGQLGRMFTIAARTMGYEVIVLDPDSEVLPENWPPTMSVPITLTRLRSTI